MTQFVDENEISRMKGNKSSELKFWLVFSIGISIVPLGFVTLFSFSWQPLLDLLSHGELFFVSLALSGERLGDIYVRQRNVGIIGLGVFFLLFLGSAFGINSVGHLGEVPLISESILFFLGTLVIGIISLRGK